SFPVTLLAPAATAPGLHNVTLFLVSRDGNRTAVPLPAMVGVLGHGTTPGLPAVLAQPGHPAVVSIPVSNTGNVPLRAWVESLPGERWPSPRPPPPQVLAPGASTTLEHAWDVPRGAADGASVHGLVLVLEPQDANAPIRREPLSVHIDVGRSDLVLQAAHSFRGAAGTLVEASIANVGARDAMGATASLLDGAEVADRITIGRLPPGQSANVTLLRTGAPAGTLIVALDAEDVAVERDESNNQAAVTPAGERAAPFPQAGALALLLAAAASARRRQTGKSSGSPA
ncbi:MAG TPA: CARDB domain-containing protein, partial [Candidatus Thermoplasmatota archaeon]|nr:CARDB domain-containing protein [Candidatus Thermoplasmatota archaeon]